MKRIVQALSVLLVVSVFWLSNFNVAQAAPESLPDAENPQVICEKAGGTVHVFGENRVGVLTCTDYDGTEFATEAWFDTCSNLDGFPEKDEDTLLCLIQEAA